MAAVTIPIVTSTRALGDIRPLASQVRGSSPAAADAHTQTQEQLDKLLSALRTGVTLSASDVASLIPGATVGVTKRGNPVTY